MKTFLTLLILTKFLIFAGSCVRQENSGREIISVSILPQKYMVESIAGDRFHINVLVPPGVSPETYELTPNQMKMLSDSRFYFITGHLAFEKSWNANFKNMNTGMQVVDLSHGIELISQEYAHGDHYHHGTDPHIWISPKTVSIMAKNIFDALSQSEPDKDNFYLQGYQALQSEISAADSILTSIFNLQGNKSFLIFHPALAYLARDYGLEQIPIEFEGKSPPPAYLKSVVDISREKGIKAVLIQKEFSTDNARSIAKEINGEIVQIDPLAENWYDEIISIGNILSKIFQDEL
jgi:zinc transport system substrate-binding protein